MGSERSRELPSEEGKAPEIGFSSPNFEGKKNGVGDEDIYRPGYGEKRGRMGPRCH